MIGYPHKKWNPGINTDIHNGIFLTPAGVPDPNTKMGLHFGALVLAAAWQGLGSNKNNGDKIKCDGQPIVSRGHEVKYCIAPHINILPPVPALTNVLGTLLIISSSSKCQFAACKVRCTDGPVAISMFRDVGINSACADPFTMPTSVILNFGTVNIGYTNGDMLAAAFLFAYEALKSFLEDQMFGALMDSKYRKYLFGPLFKLFTKAMGKKLSYKLAKEIMTGVLKLIYGETLGGKGGDAVAEKIGDKDLAAWVTDPLGTGANKMADQIAEWVDGEAQPTLRDEAHHGR